MALTSFMEDYLEAILLLKQKTGAVRAVDLARHMGYSKASVSYATSSLCKAEFLLVDVDGFLCLTEKGLQVAEEIYERHRFFAEQLIGAGVEPNIADREACRMEHAISQNSFEKIRAAHKHKI